MTTFDTIAIVVLSLSVIYSVFRGMVREIFSLLSFVVGYAGAVRFQDRGAEFAGKFLVNEIAADLMGFLFIFLAGFLTVLLVGYGVRKLVRKAGVLSTLDRALGGGIGLVKGAFCLIIFLVPLELFPDAYKSVTENSFMVPHLEKASLAMRKGLGSPSRLRDKFPDFSFEKVKDKVDEIIKIKEITEKIKSKAADLTKANGPPQEEYSKKDKQELDKLFKSFDGDGADKKSGG